MLKQGPLLRALLLPALVLAGTGAGAALGQTSASNPIAAPVAATAPSSALRRPTISGIYTLNQDLLYSRSAFGARVLRERAARRKALEAENTRLEAGLKAEEKKLTDQRKGMVPKEFRKLADAFDIKVQKIRKDQAAKSEALKKWAAERRTRFFKLAYPILLKMAAELNAVAILDERVTLISSQDINLTDRAVLRMNAEFGDGTPDTPGDAAKKTTP